MRDSATCYVASSPGFARTSIWSVAVGAEGAAIEPGVRNSISDLLLVTSQEVGGNCGGGDSHKQDVIQTDTVEAVFESEDTLDFMRFDHRSEQVANAKRSFVFSQALATDEVGN